MNDNLKQWLRAAAVRAAKTAAQAAIGVIGASTALGQVDWALAASGAVLAAVVSLLTSVAGIPEVDRGSSLPSLAKGGE
ncbi:holin [Arabiibacter massiliensis]|uniref:holin n=1 Tax=Arabiibacter massiliensis TaxID=1870985 RepID=UPI0009BB8743|nr:holin [Arabiibacter massiliensis]